MLDFFTIFKHNSEKTLEKKLKNYQKKKKN